MIGETEVKDPPGVEIAPEPVPVRRIDKDQMKILGGELTKTFERYSSDRHQAEQKWLRNLRQYLGIYDPEIEQQLGKGRSRAYPRLTRVKCISVLSRIMNLMFPGNEKNWSLSASPNADMDVEDVKQAVQRVVEKLTAAGQEAPQMDDQMVQTAVNELAEERARHLEVWIDDQLQEIGGDQTQDYVTLNRQVLKSGILNGVGILHGPFVRTDTTTKWGLEGTTPVPNRIESFKPMFEFLPIWDFYPDMSAKTFAQMDGYFIRKVMSKAQVRDLARREDFFKDVIKSYLAAVPGGDYKPKNYETMLRTLGVRENINEQSMGNVVGGKYEILVWNGTLSGAYLAAAGVAEITAEKQVEDFYAEVWMLGGHIIKCDINGWRKLGMEVNMIHAFVFDEDDTSPVGQGLPNIMRDSQMSICAATRMLLDNASITCGPNLEINTDLMRSDQDLVSIEAYKIWYREGMGAEAQYPAVRNVQIEGHLPELQAAIELFNRFADAETFVGPLTGGDMDRQKSSEPMRTAVGGAMMKADAALPFKDIVRSFDSFTMSVIYSLVQFNRKFNPDKAPIADYNVVARGATSMLAKEIRAMQLDQLVATLTDEEKLEIDARKLARARFQVRDLDDILVSETQALANRRAREQMQAEVAAQQKEQIAAEIRKLLSDAYKNIAQGQKNAANADAQVVQSVLALLEKGLEDAARSTDAQGQGAGAGGGSAE